MGFFVGSGMGFFGSQRVLWVVGFVGSGQWCGSQDASSVMSCLTVVSFGLIFIAPPPYCVLYTIKHFLVLIKCQSKKILIQMHHLGPLSFLYSLASMQVGTCGLRHISTIKKGNKKKNTYLGVQDAPQGLAVLPLLVLSPVALLSLFLLLLVVTSQWRPWWL